MKVKMMTNKEKLIFRMTEKEKDSFAHHYAESVLLAFLSAQSNGINKMVDYVVHLFMKRAIEPEWHDSEIAKKLECFIRGSLDYVLTKALLPHEEAIIDISERMDVVGNGIADAIKMMVPWSNDDDE
jgi:hypothetical protein